MNIILKLFLLLIIFTHTINAMQLNLTIEEQQWIKDNPTIKVQSMVDSTPYNFIQDGKPVGYALENVKLIASKVGLKVEMVQGNSWNESMELLKNGEIDVMPNMVKTKPRVEHYAFTSAYTPIMNVMYVKEGDFYPKSLEDLDGKTLGVAEGFSEVPLLQKHYPNIKLHFTKNGTEAFKLLSLGKIDATSYSLGAGNKIILKNALLNIIPAFEVKDKIFEKKLHMATNKNNKILRDILQKGLDSRTSEEKNELRTKWLLNQFNSSTTNKIEFTLKEKEWIENNPKISIAMMPDFSPFSHIVNDKYIGFEHDILSLISQKSGLNFDKKYDIWNKNLNAFKNKQVDILSSISYKKDRESFTSFTSAYYEIPIMIFTRDDFDNYKDINSLKGKKVGILKDVFYANELKKIDGLELVVYETYDEITKALVFGKIDALIQNLPNISYLIKKNAYTNLKLVDELKLPGINKEDLRFGINKDKPLLKSIIQKSLESITSEEFVEITNKWLNVRQNSNDNSTFNLTKKEKEWIQNNPIIKVHNETNWPPYNYAQDGKPLGYSIDVMNLIAKKTGMGVEFVTGPTWNQFLGMMKDKSLDVMLNIVKTSERQKYLLYTPPYANNPNSILSKSDKLYQDIKSLYGKTVALPKGFFTEEVLRKNHPKIKLHTTKNVLEAMKAVTFGKADAAVGELAVFNHLIAEHMMSNLVVSSEAKMGNPEYSLLNIATRKDLPILASILTKGVGSITLEEKKELQKKWLGTSKENVLKLTEEEKKYLSSKSEIKMCVHPNILPFEAIDKDGKHQGISKDVIGLISNKINKKIVLVPTKIWTQTLEKFENKECDIIPLTMKTPNRENYMQFTKPYITDSIVVATKNDKFFVKDSSDLIDKKIGVAKGFAFIELLKQKHPNIDIIIVENINDGLKMVQKGELFGYVSALPLIAYNIQKEGIIDLKVAGRLEFEVELSIASQKDQPLLNTIMQKALDEIKQEQINSIVGKWISIKFEQSLDYKILMYIVAIFIVIFTFMLFRNYTVRKMNKELEKVSITDALTNIYNRRYFNEIFPKVLNSAKRKDELVSFVIMDIDHFKQYNDTYGHQMGDDALVKVAASLKETLHRADDYCFRLGGEEFGIVFKTDSKEKALTFANKARQNIEDLNIEHNGNSASPYVTASMGLICKNANDIKDADEVYKQGDDLLYKAKESGRNRVEYN